MATSGKRLEGDPVHDILTTHAVVDSVLETFRDALGPDAMRYRNHVYRGLNYQRKLLRLSTIPDDIALAWSLHDIGIWTSGWDYIPPSLDHVDAMAPRYGIGVVDRARQMVEWHHKLRPCQDEWVETFRVADRVDVTRGVLRGALTRSDIRQVEQVFPYVGFHALLLRTGVGWATKHPLRPLPMFRW
jgi:hypothetical protein